MNKQEILEQTYDSAFQDELEKIAKTGWEPEFDKIRQESNKKGRWLPAIGMLSGAAASFPAINAIAKRTGPLGGAIAGGIAGFGGATAGVVIGAKAKEKMITRYLKKTPGSEEYQRIRALNMAGLNPESKKLNKAFSDDFNSRVKDKTDTMTNKTHLKMRKELMGY